jgi:hypothetical protein
LTRVRRRHRIEKLSNAATSLSAAGVVLREMLLDPASGITLRRTGALLAVISFITILESEHRSGTFTRLCALNALISMGFAVLLREPPLGAKLNRWDEALVFAVLWLGTGALLS